MPCASKFARRDIPCPVNGCCRFFTNPGGLSVHLGWHSSVWEAQQRRERLRQEQQEREAERQREEQRQTADTQENVPFNHTSDIGNPFDHREEAESDDAREPDVVRKTGEDIEWHPKING